ncbi:MAG: hypothetical protein CL681_26320 [Blastopirellula sp.]|nr:hypothetical protein [Blastopirellula sp.]
MAPRNGTPTEYADFVPYAITQECLSVRADWLSSKTLAIQDKKVSVAQHRGSVALAVVKQANPPVTECLTENPQVAAPRDCKPPHTCNTIANTHHIKYFPSGIC